MFGVALVFVWPQFFFLLLFLSTCDSLPVNQKKSRRAECFGICVLPAKTDLWSTVKARLFPWKASVRVNVHIVPFFFSSSSRLRATSVYCQNMCSTIIQPCYLSEDIYNLCDNWPVPPYICQIPTQWAVYKRIHTCVRLMWHCPMSSGHGRP